MITWYAIEIPIQCALKICSMCGDNFILSRTKTPRRREKRSCAQPHVAAVAATPEKKPMNKLSFEQETTRKNRSKIHLSRTITEKG